MVIGTFIRGMDAIPRDVQKSVEEFENASQVLISTVEPLVVLMKSHREQLEGKLSALQKAKLELILAYSINTLYYCKCIFLLEILYGLIFL